jgi:hypothetical protein
VHLWLCTYLQRSARCKKSGIDHCQKKLRYNVRFEYTQQRPEHIHLRRRPHPGVTKSDDSPTQLDRPNSCQNKLSPNPEDLRNQDPGMNPSQEHLNRHDSEQTRYRISGLSVIQLVPVQSKIFLHSTNESGIEISTIHPFDKSSKTPGSEND